MKVKSVSYQKTIPLAAYTNHRIGVEIELSHGDTPEATLEYAKTLVEEFHKKTSYSIDEYRGTHIRDVESEQVEEIQRPTDKVEGLIFDINSCKEVKVLESYKLLASKHSSVVQDAYNNKMNELLNQ